MCDVEGLDAKPLEPKDISALAMSGEDAQCVSALETFCAFFGTVAGNLVLTYGGKGGVYIAGGIVPRLVDFLKTSAFNDRFSNKGVMSHYLEDVPVNLIAYDQVAFLGAAAWLDQME